jgi:hypothetical protein
LCASCRFFYAVKKIDVCCSMAVVIAVDTSLTFPIDPLILELGFTPLIVTSCYSVTWLLIFPVALAV